MAGTPGLPDSWTLDDEAHSPLPRDLSGFRYDQLGGITSGAQYDLAQIDPDILIDWVNASGFPGMTGYRPQPYGALEDALRNMGAQAAATEVAYARLKHRANTRVSANWRTDFVTWVGQNLIVVWDRFLQFTVGFGVYPYYAFFWFLGLVIAGSFLARPCPQLCKDSAKKATWGDSIFYSLENAIPLMEPSSDYARVKHDNYLIRMFFNFQKVGGFVLATVLIGALTLGG